MDASGACDLHRIGETSRRRGSWLAIVGDKWTHDELSISIGWPLSIANSVHWGETCGHIATHLDALMVIGRWKLNVREIVAHDHRVIVAIDYLAPDQTACVFRGNSSLKTDVFSLVLLTLDWIMKQLSNFEGRSWVHHESPMFRLDRNPIEVGFIVINRRIRSNFPLERRTSAEEEIKPIIFNLRELKPNIHGNWVNSEIRSFIQR